MSRYVTTVDPTWVGTETYSDGTVLHVHEDHYPLLPDHPGVTFVQWHLNAMSLDDDEQDLTDAACYYIQPCSDNLCGHRWPPTGHPQDGHERFARFVRQWRPNVLWAGVLTRVGYTQGSAAEVLAYVERGSEYANTPEEAEKWAHKMFADYAAWALNDAYVAELIHPSGEIDRQFFLDSEQLMEPDMEAIRLEFGLDPKNIMKVETR